MTVKYFFRAAGAIIAGILVGALLSVLTDTILEQTGIFPSFEAQMSGEETLSAGLLLLAAFYRCIYTVLSGYIGARLAPANPMKYAIALGVIATIANLAGLIFMGDVSDKWYPILLTLTALPCTWLGGKLKIM